jgi:hypothetical protein
MKILPFLFLFLTFVCQSQKSYPYLYEDSVGKQFVILTFEQAQRLDNATEFSPLLWKDHTSYYQLVDSLCERKLETKNIEIMALKKNIDTISIWYSAYAKSYELCENKVAMLNNKNEVSEEINKSLKQKVNSLENYNQKTEMELKQSKRNIGISIFLGFITTIAVFIFSL